jgi:hypothetical protein
MLSGGLKGGDFYVTLLNFSQILFPLHSSTSEGLRAFGGQKSMMQ